MFHHAGVGSHQRRVGVVLELQRDVFAQNAPQHAGHVADDFFHVQLPRLHHLAAAKGQELPSQAGGPFSGLADLLGGPGGDATQGTAGQEQRGVTLDDSQDIVKIMGHPARELADGFHLL